ncbi:hypothetical protein SHIRM173S_03920 [Streptomyces hirsutus]
MMAAQLPSWKRCSASYQSPPRWWPGAVAGRYGGRGEGLEVGQRRQQHPLEVLRGSAGLIEETGVLDGDAVTGQRRHHVLVLVVERPAVTPVAQVEVAVDPAAHVDRHPEQGTDRRVPRGKADGVRVARQVLHAQRLGVGNQHAQQAPAVREFGSGQVLVLLGAQAERDELLQARAVVVQHAESPVAGVDEFHRGTHILPQYHGQIEFPADGEDRAQQSPHALLRPGQVIPLLGDAVQVLLLVEARRLRASPAVVPGHRVPPLFARRGAHVTHPRTS